MAKTKEVKLAEDFANAAEDHWFNTAIIGRILAEQPHYTTDRLMEMLAQIIKNISRRAEVDISRNIYNEGQFLAIELNKLIEDIKLNYTFENLKLK